MDLGEWAVGPDPQEKGEFWGDISLPVAKYRD